MNKVILRISLLGFFVSIMLFGMQSMPLPDVIIYALTVSLAILIAAIIYIATRRYFFHDQTYIRGNQNKSKRPEHPPVYPKTWFNREPHPPYQSVDFDWTIAQERRIIFRTKKR